MCEVAHSSKDLTTAKTNINDDGDVYEAAEPTLSNMPVEVILRFIIYIYISNVNSKSLEIDFCSFISQYFISLQIILKICSFLEADVLKYTLSKVCRRFEDILADDHLWKYWVHSKIKGFFPVLPNLKIWEETQIDWEGVCVEMDVERKKWSNVNNTMKHIVVKDVHYASVDTVLLANVSIL